MNDNNEMLPADIFTRPRVWKTKVHIKHLLTDEEDLTPEQINEKGKAVAQILKRCRFFENDDVMLNDDYFCRRCQLSARYLDASENAT